eukprot:TRINITY_DN21926_c0_g1_i2.p1 TRINITY_DN21926_c0_g1~~TRINITY_DN21926_c0_g1_i2.p1  ORF type:complete len:125 (-),score=1.01 TRINITY_DN21926_c0_g1_i2:32-406(-)
MCIRDRKEMCTYSYYSCSMFTRLPFIFVVMGGLDKPPRPVFSPIPRINFVLPSLPTYRFPSFISFWQNFASMSMVCVLRRPLSIVFFQNLSLIHISEPTRLLSISYAVFCLKKKKNKIAKTHST